jgi:hypothetical protein
MIWRVRHCTIFAPPHSITTEDDPRPPRREICVRTPSQWHGNRAAPIRPGDLGDHETSGLDLDYRK